MRVLHIITGLAAGGAEHQLRLFVQHSRHDNAVLSLTTCGTVGQEIARGGTPVTELGMRSNREPGALLRLVQRIRRGHYDIVHVHLYRACIFGRLAARLAGVPHVVTTEHSIGTQHIEGRSMTPAVRRLYLATERCTDTTIAVSDAVRQRLIDWGVAPARITVIPNAVESEAFGFDPLARRRVRRELGLAAQDFVVGALGRLVPGKRIATLIEALTPLLGPGVRLVVAGAGPERARLEEQAHRAGLEDHVTFVGEAPDVPALLSALDLVVSASEEETFGLSVLEAVASGVPVVFRECPPLQADPVGDGAARHVPAGVLALRAAIADEIAHGARRNLPGPTRFAPYRPMTVAVQVDELYERLFAKARDRGNFQERLRR